MISRRRFGSHCGVAGSFVLAMACQSVPDASDSSETVTLTLPNGACNQAQPEDVLIAQLVKDSWVAQYPLTRLFVDSSSNVTGPSLPAILQFDLDVINGVPAAKTAVSAAVATISGLPDYQPDGFGPETPACSAVPAWTPNGITQVATTEVEVFTTAVNQDSWRKTHKAFGKECPLLRRTGNQDLLDPPGDGSTNMPPGGTVSATGVTANAYGLCPTGTAPGTFCKLSYATGVNYMGRKCLYYYGSLRCLLY
ncbi:MAG TPA: hypothetical protein VFQ61_18415 [Polyangiaceae bacterium]|nr:hypothetical protein [Polyangiaceae bacterium]